MKRRNKPAQNADKGTLVPAKNVQQRYGIADRTLDRWIANSAMKFPQPLVINRRRYFYENHLSEWERKRAATRNEAA